MVVHYRNMRERGEGESGILLDNSLSAESGWRTTMTVVGCTSINYCTITTNSSSIWYFFVTEMAEKFSFDLRRIKKNT